MPKKFILVLVLIFAFSLYIVPASAIVIGPPPSCNVYTSKQIGDTFSPIGSPEYQNGLLIYHFSYNPGDPSEDILGYVNLMTANNCGYTGARTSNTDVVFPLGINKFSLRFVSNTEFKFFDDGTNQPIVCDGCDVSFSPTVGSPYKVQFSLSDGPDNDQFTSLPINVNGQSMTPVLIIPGIMGTEVYKGADELWPNVTKMLFNSGDAFMDPLSNLSNGTPLDTSLTFPSVIDKKPKFDYTQGFVSDLVSEGYSTNVNLFLFPYDWRRDIDDVAVTDDPTLQNMSLKQIIDQILLSTGSSKIDIVAHSQGGLVVKRLLADMPDYQSKIDKLIFVGTPNLGAPFAAKTLLYGDGLSVSFLGMGLAPSEVQKISQNMPSVYELLPSQEYFNHASGYLGNLDPTMSLIGGTNYNFSQTGQALKDLGENSALIDKANAFHSGAYDNMDFSNTGIQTYNIMGCQSGTVGQILVGSDGKYHLNYRAGDGTVPIISASNIYGSQNYYSLDTGSIHGTMLTTNGIRQQIENILTGSNLSTNNIIQDPSQCHYNGEQVSVHSPVDLQIYDENGDHVGPNTDGSFDYNIDGVQYDTIGHDKFAYLPPGHTYTIKLPATAAGSFDFDSSEIQEGQITATAHYDAVPITTSSIATVALNAQDNQPIQLDVNGDGKTMQTIQPSSILNSNQSLDITPPVSTSTISGTMGHPGFYKSNVSMALAATDPIIDNNASTTSGVMNIRYSLDNASSTIYQSPISVATEGAHTISFFSTDKAGNNEQAQTVNFTVDKTAPEAVVQFNPSLKDIQFTGSDNISTTSKVTVADNVNDILLTDQAGNTTDIKLKEKNRKVSMQSTIQSLSYNGTSQDISKNTLAFLWMYDKNNNLTMLSQNISAKKTYVILAVYNGKNTSLVGLDKTGIILKSISGLDLLKVTTNHGDLTWSY